ncbi:MAG: hypothetical protein AB1813_27680 [Verrucomicrobiota bacterium]|jgi:hypothetical protein
MTSTRLQCPKCQSNLSANELQMLLCDHCGFDLRPRPSAEDNATAESTDSVWCFIWLAVAFLPAFFATLLFDKNYPLLIVLCALTSLFAAFMFSRSVTQNFLALLFLTGVMGIGFFGVNIGVVMFVGCCNAIGG